MIKKEPPKSPPRHKRASANIDHIFAKRFGTNEVERNFLAHMISLAREGHLCFQSDEVLDSTLITELNETTEWFDNLIGKWDNWYYLQRNWVIEARIAKELKRLLNRAVKQLDFVGDSSLNVGQHNALKQVLESSITCITGGPGTGKTYLIGKLIAAFLSQSEGKVVVAAPTGKAVRQLKNHLNQVLLTWSERIEVDTLHAVLGIKKREDLLWNKQKLNATLLIVDECSMIDAALWGALLKGIDTPCRSVFVGDHNQLPPVEAGTLFGEICRYLKENKPSCYAKLTESLRMQHTQLLTWTQRILEGKRALDLPLHPKLDLTHWMNYFPKPQPNKLDYATLFEELKRFRLLSCLRQGKWGVEALNEAITSHMRSLFTQGDYWAIPLLMTASDRNLGIFNGDSGLLIKRSQAPYVERNDIAIFEKETGHEEIAATLLPPFEYGYCLSVHKSQGSEYERVALVVPPGSESFGREILYTGLTRAKDTIDLIGDPLVIEGCLSHSSQKDSRLTHRLCHISS